MSLVRPTHDRVGLVLVRTPGERVFIDIPPSTQHRRLIVTQCDVVGLRSKLGFDGPREISVQREERLLKPPTKLGEEHDD